MNKTNSGRNLYQLISRMTSSERRYFKIFSRNHTIGLENNYLRLFDLILKHLKSDGSLDEKNLKLLFSRQYGKQRFDLYKNNLYKKLLQCLEVYNKKRFIEIGIRSQINHANILNHKGLPHQALQCIEKAKKVCQHHEKWYMLLELLELERHVTYAIQSPSFDNKQELEVIKKVQNLGILRDIQSKIWKNYITNGLPTDELGISSYTVLRENKIFLQSEASFSMVANMTRLYCLQFIAGMEGKIKETYNYGKALLNIMDNHPDYMLDKGEMYIRCLINWQYAQMRLNLYPEVIDNINKCRSLLSDYILAPAFKHSINISLFVNEYDINFKNGESQDLQVIIGGLNLYISSNSDHLGGPTLMLYYWQNAMHHFAHDDYESLLDWTSKIREMKTPYRRDIKALARIVDLIAYYELKNFQLLKSYTINTFRYLKNQERLLPIESFLIDFIKSVLSKIKFNKPAKSSFIKCKRSLKQLKKNDQSHESLLLMYFENWLDRKISMITKVKRQGEL